MRLHMPNKREEPMHNEIPLGYTASESVGDLQVKKTEKKFSTELVCFNNNKRYFFLYVFL